MMIDVIKLKLSAQRGLLGNVFSQLRAVCIDSKKKMIKAHFYIDGEIDDDQKESCESTLDQIIADFCHCDEIEFEFPLIRLDYPKKPVLFGYWVYYRQEDSSRYE